MNKKLFTLLPLLAIGLAACGEAPTPAPSKGRGTLENPLTVDEVCNHEDVLELASMAATDEYFYVTGVTKTASYDTGHNSVSVKLESDDDESFNTFEFYSLAVDESVVMEGEDEEGAWTYKASSALASATFIGYGRVYKYNSTLEFRYQEGGKIVSIEGATKVRPSTDTHGKVETDPLTFAEALEIIQALPAKSATDDVYWFKARIAKINTKPNSDFDNCGMDVNADGNPANTSVIVLFRCYVDGHAKTQAFFDWFDENLTVGTEVLVQGNLQKYGNDNTPEVSNSNGKTGIIYLLDAQGAKHGYVPANA